MEAHVIVAYLDRPVHLDHAVSISAKLMRLRIHKWINRQFIDPFYSQHVHQPVTEEFHQWQKEVAVLVQTVVVIQNRRNAQSHAQEAVPVHVRWTIKVTIKCNSLAFWLKFYFAILQSILRQHKYTHTHTKFKLGPKIKYVSIKKVFSINKNTKLHYYVIRNSRASDLYAIFSVLRMWICIFWATQKKLHEIILSSSNSNVGIW